MNRDSHDNDFAHALDVLRSFDACMLTTMTADGLLHARPLAIAAVEDDGHVAMFTDDDSPKAFEIMHDARIAVTMQGPRKFAALSGFARLNRDRDRIRALWQQQFEPWFALGVDDPKIVVVEVEPEAVEIWDHSGFKGIRALFERARAAMSNDVAQIPEGVNVKVSGP